MNFEKIVLKLGNKSFYLRTKTMKTNRYEKNYSF